MPLRSSGLRTLIRAVSENYWAPAPATSSRFSLWQGGTPAASLGPTGNACGCSKARRNRRPVEETNGVGGDTWRQEGLRPALRDPWRQRRDRRRRVRRAGGSFRLRQVDPAADDRRPREHQRRRDQDRRPRRQHAAAQGARRRHGVPELRALSAHDGRRQHGLLDAAARRAEDRRSTRGSTAPPRS